MKNEINMSDVWKWAKDLFPLNRSLTGTGNLETLKYLKGIDNNLSIKYFSSGKKVFDWTVPDEWSVKSAYLLDSKGKKLCDFGVNNLHLVGYSIGIKTTMDLSELKAYLHYDKNNPDAIPYRTSYYERRWGFCISYNDYKKLIPGDYKVFIDATHFSGKMHYGELLIPGDEPSEILLSTYICHPSMANNELSGPLVSIALARHIKSNKVLRRYSYRILFLPETIGAISYIHKHQSILESNVIAGYVLTCVGDDREYSYLPSKYGDTLADKAAQSVIRFIDPNYKKYTFLKRGSDERQYCGPNINLPVCSVMRSRYGDFKEYHTSKDNLSFISKSGLLGSIKAYADILFTLNKNNKYKSTVTCEPMMSKRGLRPTMSGDPSVNTNPNLMNILVYSDGKKDVFDISDILDLNPLDVISGQDTLLSYGLIRE